MGIEIEAQDHIDLMQIRSRELQLENTNKLEEIIPVVQTINDVDLQSMESNTNDIKDMITTNIDNQVDLNEIAEQLTNISKSITELKKSTTRLNNNVKEITKKVKTIEDGING